MGTDGEQPLIDAFMHEFGFAQHLTCFIHVRRNVKERLHVCNVPTLHSTEILDDIFGRKLGTVYIEGLVDACDTIDLDSKVEKAVSKWRSFDHPSTTDLEGFVSWFQTCKVPVIRDSMLKTVREECGLGSPPDLFTTNASETANSILKNRVDYKRSELPEFLRN